MAPPRISANLYNCSLNCALPHIVEGIKQIALQGDESDIAYRDAFELLKTKFEQWYSVSIPWHDFNILLSGFTFNEIELIMAPVLRLFVAEKCDPAERVNLRDIILFDGQGIDPEVIQMFRDLGENIPFNSPGRYVPLGALNANEYFYKHFGLFMRVHEFVEGCNPEQYRQIEAQTELLPIDVYLKHGHFELQTHLGAPQHDYRNQTIAHLVETISSDQSAHTTNRALANLVTFISTVSSQIPALSAHVLTRPEDYIANAERFRLHRDCTEGQLTYAVILLTLMQNVPETKTYASKKLIESVGLQDRAAIEALLTEAKEVAKSPGSTQVRLQASQIAAKSISKEDFNAILAGYQTTYWFVNVLVRLFTFGYYGHESNTIKALKELSNHDSITNDMVTNVLSQDNHDSQQTRRLSFWRDDSEAQSNSGTDIVLRQLKAQLQ